MQERAKGLAIATELTTAYVGTSNRYSGFRWRAWGKDAWGRVRLSALLALWISAAAVIWFHLSNDLRDTLRDLNRASFPASGPVPGHERRHRNV